MATIAVWQSEVLEVNALFANLLFLMTSNIVRDSVASTSDTSTKLLTKLTMVITAKQKAEPTIVFNHVDMLVEHTASLS